ncbi:NAD(P)-binding protein [Hygrophoropsis aurantiaca]|uniref:NAD(P)-binding protein n=1 Tax=Hygrophoropsis aurantiaca TaxID=72124 RepID=A0ACB8ASQ1_9AGAM|nr:NAD(P)-binding protein [Hygrophoropsis aurantiaca]
MKNILVIGATGKQGRSLIESLRCINNITGTDTNEPTRNEFHILALTRKATSPSAQRLAEDEHVQIVEGDLDRFESIRKIFEDAKNTGGIWGVYSVLAFPGLGASAEGEERQGKALADLALEYGVSVYIYSSAERAGEVNDDHEKLSGRAKVMIERHVKGLGEKGLPWTIMRPGFFLDNYEGFIGSITVAVMKQCLKPDTKLGTIASSDIGRVAAAVFQEPDKYRHQELVVIGDVLTMSEQDEAHRRATGKPLPAIPGILVKLLMMMNKSTQELCEHFEDLHTARATGKHDKFESQREIARSAYPQMKTVYDWSVAKHKSKSDGDQGKEWNQVSIWKLLTGKL